MAVVTNAAVSTNAAGVRRAPLLKTDILPLTAHELELSPVATPSLRAAEKCSLYSGELTENGGEGKTDIGDPHLAAVQQRTAD